MRKFIKALLFLVCSSCLWLGSSQASYAAEAYKLHSGDGIEISVVNKLNPLVYVADFDGNFTMPMIGVVNVENKTVEALKAELTTRLSEYIKRPEVIVNIKEYGNINVNVLGEVRKPGTQSLAKGYTLVDAIAKAGGFKKKAAKRRVVCLHAGEKLPFAIVNVQEVLRGSKDAVNPTLRAGDIIYVESNKKVF